MTKTYKIKILTSGPIRTLAGIHGPIITPYVVDHAKLIRLLNEGCKIVRVNGNGSETPITLTDIIGDNATKKVVNTTPPSVTPEVKKTETPEPNKVEEVDVTPVVEEVPEEVVEPVVEDVVEDISEAIEETVAEEVAEPVKEEATVVESDVEPSIEPAVADEYVKSNQTHSKKKRR